jgi:hypothetical protein
VQKMNHATACVPGAWLHVINRARTRCHARSWLACVRRYPGTSNTGNRNPAGRETRTYGGGAVWD